MSSCGSIVNDSEEAKEALRKENHEVCNEVFVRPNTESGGRDKTHPFQKEKEKKENPIPMM